MKKTRKLIEKLSSDSVQSSKGKEGCLSLNRGKGNAFVIDDCSDLKSPICIKNKDLIFKKSSNCGPNTFVDRSGECHCKPRAFERSPGDANSILGCKSKLAIFIQIWLIFLTFFDLFMLSDPCDSDPCGENTFCQSVSATNFQCFCSGDLAPISGNARKYGCGKRSKKNNRKFDFLRHQSILFYSFRTRIRLRT